MRHLAAICISLSLFLSPKAAVAQDINTEAIDAIERLTGIVCNNLEPSGSVYRLALGAGAQAEAEGLLRFLEGLGANLDAERYLEEYDGVARDALPDLLASSEKCRLEVFRSLQSALVVREDARLGSVERLIDELADRCEAGNFDRDGSLAGRIWLAIDRLEESYESLEAQIDVLDVYLWNVQEYCRDRMSVQMARSSRGVSFEPEFSGPFVPATFFSGDVKPPVAFDLYFGEARCGGQWSSRNDRNFEHCEIGETGDFSLRNLTIMWSLVPPSARARLPRQSATECMGRVDPSSAEIFRVVLCFDGRFRCDLVPVADWQGGDDAIAETLRDLQIRRDACVFSG